MVNVKNLPKGTIILFISFIILIIAIYFLRVPAKQSIPQELIAVLRPLATPIQPFTLTDQNKNVFTEKNITGKWSMLFFGYTHCPDVCPTTLHTLQKINKSLQKNATITSKMQTIFVSVDPERDKPDILKKYTQYFNKDFIALTGENENLHRFIKQFAAAYIKEPPTAPGEYLISHTGSIFLVDPKMRIVASFSPPHNAKTIVSQFLKIQNIYQ